MQIEDVPKCKTCKNWKFYKNISGIYDDIPYCKELHYIIAVPKYVHTTADFGCTEHSELKT